MISRLGPTCAFVSSLLSLVVACAAGQTAPVPVIQTVSDVHRIAFSPDSKRIAVIDPLGRNPDLWDIETGHKLLGLRRTQFRFSATNSFGQVYQSFSGSPSHNEVLGFAADGWHLAVTDPRDPERPPAVWDLRTGEAIGPWNRDSSGKLTLAGTEWTEDDVRAWGFGRRPTVAPAFARAGAISMDGSLAAVSTGAKDTLAVQVWDIKANRMLASIPLANKTNSSLAFSPDNNMLAIVIGYGAEVWQLKPLEKLATIAPYLWGYGIRFSPDGHYVVLNGSGELRAVRVGAWETAVTFKLPQEESRSISDAAISPDGHYLAVADGGLHVWELESGKQKLAIEATDARPVSALSVSPDGSTLAVGFESSPNGMYAAGNGRLELWSLAAGSSPRIFATDLATVQSLAFSHDSQWLGAASQDSSTTGRYTTILVGNVRLWHVADADETRIELKNKKLQAEDWSASNVAFSPDDKQLVAVVFTPGVPSAPVCDPGIHCGDAETVPYNVRTSFFDVATGHEVNSTPLGGAESLRAPRRSFWLSPDGRRAFAADTPLRYIDTLTGRKVRSFQLPPIAPATGGSDDCVTGLEAFGFAAFSKDMQLVAISDHQSFMVLDSHSGASRTEDPRDFSDDNSLDYQALTGAFSSDGKAVAISTCSQVQRDGELRLYRAADLKLVSKTSMQAPVTSIADTPDGSFFFTGSSDGILRLWNVDNGSLAATLVENGDGAWIVFTPEGLYDSSPKGAALLAWRTPGDLVMAAERPQMRVPGLLSKILSRKPLQSPAP